MGSLNSILLSVIICTRNRAAQVPICITRVAEQASAYTDVEVLVVDNASTDDTFMVVQQCEGMLGPAVRYIYEGEPGITFARNAGRGHARGRVLAYIDDDAVPGDDWVANIRQHFLQGMSDCLAGKVTVETTEILPSWFPLSLMWVLGESAYGPLSRRLRQDESPQGQNFAITTGVFDAVGGFDTTLPPYGGDEVEFFRRVNALRFSTVYRPDIVVRHCMPPSRLSRGAVLKKAYAMGRGAGTVERIGMRSALISLRQIYAIARVMYLICRVALSYCVRPRFDKIFTLWFNWGFLLASAAVPSSKNTPNRLESASPCWMAQWFINRT